MKLTIFIGGKVKQRTTCRISGESLVELFSLGNLYVSDFLKPGEEPNPENKVPLTLCLAPKSGLVQLKHTADFDLMYKRYWYHSGTNQSMTIELKEIAEMTNKLYKGDGREWLDIGCNDGTLFKFVGKDDWIRFGMDPVFDNVERASEHCEMAHQCYFRRQLYYSYRNEPASIITSIAMFYDLEDPHAFISDIYDVLADDGIWVMQLSYLPLMLKQLAFDNICHEHLEYYSLTVLEELLRGHGFKVMDFQLNDTNGGSCRVFIQKSKHDHRNFGTAPYRDVAGMRAQYALEYEKQLNLKDPQTYIDFFLRVEKLKEEAVNFIKTQCSQGKKIWAYGASTKGNTLLQYFGLGPDDIEGISERQEIKFGLRTVGTNIPICSDPDMRKANPDYVLVLPWHFINEFVKRESEYLSKGGKFITPCPKFEIIGG